MAYKSSHDDLLPESKSSELCLSHPTLKECEQIWTNTSASWKSSLSVPVYLEESLFLTTVPLAKDGGMTTWVLVDKNAPPDQRAILCSCESFRKRALTSDPKGNVSDAIIHGIASVFCPPDYRGRGYAVRMLTELAQVFRTWQSDHGKCVGSILYSDIGKQYYAKLGWKPTLTNIHVVFQPSATRNPVSAQLLPVEELAELCLRDEIMTRDVMAKSEERSQTLVTVVPDLDHMLWHLGKEGFVCNQLFGKVPQAKGAIAGTPGHQVWALWTHRYYGRPDNLKESQDNILYILRVVVEGQKLDLGSAQRGEGEKKSQADVHHKQVGYLKAVIEAAQAEAAEWKLSQVRLWEPTSEVRSMLVESGIEHAFVDRQETSIASAMWYDVDDAEGQTPLWFNNEHYAWC